MIAKEKEILTCDKVIFFETNNEVLGYACRLYQQEFKQQDINSSQRDLGLLASVVSIIFESKNCGANIDIQIPTDTVVLNVKIQAGISIVAQLEEPINKFNSNDASTFEYSKDSLSRDEYDSVLGKEVKQAVYNMMETGRTKENFEKNVFMNILKLVNENKMDDELEVNIPVSKYLFSIKLSCKINKNKIH